MASVENVRVEGHGGGASKELEYQAGEAKWVVGRYEKDQCGWVVRRETELGPQGPPRQTKRIQVGAAALSEKSRRATSESVGPF